MSKYEIVWLIAAVCAWLLTGYVLLVARAERRAARETIRLMDRQYQEFRRLAQDRVALITAIRVSLTDCMASPDVNLNGRARELILQCLTVLGWKQRPASAVMHGNVKI